MRKKDYQKKKLNNPFFPRVKKGGGGPLAKFFYFVIAIIFIFSFSYFLTNERFEIKEIIVSGNEKVKEAEVRGVVESVLAKRRFLFFKQDNFFLFKESLVKESLEKNFLIDKVKVDKKFFDGVEVIITEKPKGLIWSVNNQEYYLDLGGVAIKPLDASDLIISEVGTSTEVIRPEASSGVYPLVYDQSATEVILGEQVASSEMINFIITLDEEIARLTDIDVSHYVMPRPYFDEVFLVTKQGFEVRFKKSDNPAEQVVILNSVLRQKINDLSNLEYIDLRFGERVFYK